MEHLPISTDIYYRKGYKYQLARPYHTQTHIFPPKGQKLPGANGFITLHPDGFLDIESGYAWDGASGPAADTPKFMRGSLVHDALYQLLRAGQLLPIHREAVDELLYKNCLEDGMCRVKAYIAWKAVRCFGASAASTRSLKQIVKAPNLLRLEPFSQKIKGSRTLREEVKSGRITNRK